MTSSGIQQEQPATIGSENVATTPDGKCDFYLIFEFNNGGYDLKYSKTNSDENFIQEIVNATIDFKSGSVADYTNNNNITYKIVALKYNDNVDGLTETTSFKDYFGEYNKFVTSTSSTADTSQPAFIKKRLADCLKPSSSGGNRFTKTIRSKDITHWRRNKSNRNRRQNKRI